MNQDKLIIENIKGKYTCLRCNKVITKNDQDTIYYYKEKYLCNICVYNAIEGVFLQELRLEKLKDI